MTSQVRRALRGIAYGTSVAAVTVAALVTLPEVGPLIGFSAVVAVAAALLPTLWLADRIRLVPPASLVACGVSLAVTFLYPGPAVNATANWWLLETVALLVLIVPAVRRPSPRTSLTLGTLLIITVTLLPLRLILRVDPHATFGQASRLCLAWALLSAASVGGGCYLRSLDSRSRAAVVAERRTQRVDLARDLHDFAAHDVTGVVVLAQAAQVLAREDPRRAIELLPRIEAAGAQALAAMDRTVQVFAETARVERGEAVGQPGGAEVTPRLPRDLGELPSLVSRFTRTGSIEASLDLASGALEELPNHVSSLGYRVVVEALTNVRRHAAGATKVRIAVFRAPHDVVAEALHVLVTDDGRQCQSPPDLADPDRQGGGFGLTSLTERVEAQSGTLAAGPRMQGWQVSAVLPITASPRARHQMADVDGPAEVRSPLATSQIR